MERRRKVGLRVVYVLGAVAGAYAIAAAVGLWPPAAICRHPAHSPMHSDATSLAMAAMLYLRENGSGSCPTAEELKRERFLDRAKNTDDIWGTSFRIECDANQAAVVSAGPDLAFDTEDDFEASKL